MPIETRLRPLPPIANAIGGSARSRVSMGIVVIGVLFFPCFDAVRYSRNVHLLLTREKSRDCLIDAQLRGRT